MNTQGPSNSATIDTPLRHVCFLKKVLHKMLTASEGNLHLISFLYFFSKFLLISNLCCNLFKNLQICYILTVCCILFFPPFATDIVNKYMTSSLIWIQLLTTFQLINLKIMFYNLINFTIFSQDFFTDFFCLSSAWYDGRALKFDFLTGFLGESGAIFWLFFELFIKIQGKFRAGDNLSQFSRFHGVYYSIFIWSRGRLICQILLKLEKSGAIFQLFFELLTKILEKWLWREFELI